MGFLNIGERCLTRKLGVMEEFWDEDLYKRRKEVNNLWSFPFHTHMETHSYTHTYTKTQLHTDTYKQNKVYSILSVNDL